MMPTDPKADTREVEEILVNKSALKTIVEHSKGNRLVDYGEFLKAVDVLAETKGLLS